MDTKNIQPTGANVNPIMAQALAPWVPSVGSAIASPATEASAPEWTVTVPEGSNGYCHLNEAGRYGRNIATFWGDGEGPVWFSVGEAQRAAHAVNSHDALVAALWLAEAALEYHVANGDTDSGEIQALDAVRAALALSTPAPEASK